MIAKTMPAGLRPDDMIQYARGALSFPPPFLNGPIEGYEPAGPAWIAAFDVPGANPGTGDGPHVWARAFTPKPAARVVAAAAAHAAAMSRAEAHLETTWAEFSAARGSGKPWPGPSALSYAEARSFCWHLDLPVRDNPSRDDYGAALLDWALREVR